MRALDLTNYFDTLKLRKNKSNIKKIFFYRICGTGMGATAALMKDKGLQVEGFDLEFYPPMGDYLKKLQIPLLNKKPSIEKLKEFDLIVVGNVLARNSDEAEMIEKSGVSFCSFPAALGGLILDDYTVLGLSGTHGKTTTTYFALQVFENLGQSCGYLIGGVLEGRKSSAAPNGKYFFIEADEYDSAYFEKISKFRLYRPNHLVLTSLEFDHADIFSSLDDIKDQFRALLKDFEGHYIYCDEYLASEELNNEFSLQGIPYGDNIKILEQGPHGTRFSIANDEFETNIIGRHNILNLSSVILFALKEGFTPEQINKAIHGLKMVKRRQELKGTYKGAIVIDDFAHHPRAVEETLSSIRCHYPEKQIVTIIEPNSATARSDLFQDEFTNALKKSDLVVVARPLKSTTVKNSNDLDCNKMVEDLNKEAKKAYMASKLEELLSIIDNLTNDNRLLLILSNGTCLGLWKSTFSSQLTPVQPEVSC
ncbi:MAG: UDP-N-acetylmuramate--L-alanine ligase [Bacteriovoracaceae bacterium]